MISTGFVKQINKFQWVDDSLLSIKDNFTKEELWAIVSNLPIEIAKSIKVGSNLKYSLDIATMSVDLKTIEITDIVPPFAEKKEAWHEREVRRFINGEYKPLHSDIKEYSPNRHFAHIVEDGLISFTANEKHGEADRKTTMKVGRYLKKYHPYLSDEAIKHLSILHKASLQETITVLFTTDKYKINQIFETELMAEGARDPSCMYDKFREWVNRPYHVYANSPDVAVAYAENENGIFARSVVSTAYKKYVRVYAYNGCDIIVENFETALEKLGYKSGSLLNNRLSYVTDKDTGEPLLPYIDGDYKAVTKSGSYWRICKYDDDAEYDCENTDGKGIIIECEDCGYLRLECVCNMCGECGEYENNCTCTYCEDCGELDENCECEDEEEDENEEDENANSQ